MLSPYSSQALKSLLTLLPEFAEAVTLKEEVFQFTFTTPAGWMFWLSSEEEDCLTVGLAEYHCHFGNYAGTTAEQDAVAAATFIKALREGELVVVVQHRGEQYVGSWVQAATDAVPVGTGESATPFSRLKETFQVKMWTT